jgi:hypothetical protein
MLFPHSSSIPESIRPSDNEPHKDRGSQEEITLRGLLNLLVLLLIASNIGSIVKNLRTRDFLMYDAVSNLFRNNS